MKKIAVRLLLAVLQIIATLVIFQLITHVIGLRYFYSLWPLVLILGALVLITVLHEAGHIIAGWWVGYRLLRLQVAFIRLDVGRDGLRWQVRANSMRGAGGFTVMVPEHVERLRWRNLIMTAGGPLASLISGVMMTALFIVAEGGVWGRFFIGFWGLNSIALGLINLIPFEAGSVLSDGGRMMRLARGGPHAAYMVAMSTLFAMLHTGKRPREFPPGLIAPITALGDGSLDDINGHLVAYAHADDSGDYVAAEAYLRYALGYAADYHVTQLLPLYLELTTFTALVLGDAVTARAHYAHTTKLRIEPQFRLIPEAALALAEGDHPTARHKAHEALAHFSQREDGSSAAATASRILAAAA